MLNIALKTAKSGTVLFFIQISHLKTGKAHFFLVSEGNNWDDFSSLLHSDTSTVSKEQR